MNKDKIIRFHLNHYVVKCLRFYQRIAHKQYTCKDCEIPIFPGDYYGANVCVYGKKLWIERFHIGCPVNPNDDRENREPARVELSEAA